MFDDLVFSELTVIRGLPGQTPVGGDRAMPVPSAQLPGAPVVGGQVIHAVAAAPGERLAVGGVRRRLVLARAGAVDCPEPVMHDFKVPPIRWRWQINVRQRGPL